MLLQDAEREVLQQGRLVRHDAAVRAHLHTSVQSLGANSMQGDGRKREKMTIRVGVKVDTCLCASCPA